MTVLLAILSRIWPYLLGVVLLIAGYLMLNETCWNAACKRQQSKAEQAHDALDSLQDAIAKANKQAEVDRATDEEKVKRAAATATVEVMAAEARAASADAESARILAADRARLHSIVLPGSVRAGYNAAIRFKTYAASDSPQSSQEGSAPGIAADEYASVCNRNASAMTKLADDYDALYAFTEALRESAQRKETP